MTFRMGEQGIKAGALLDYSLSSKKLLELKPSNFDDYSSKKILQNYFDRLLDFVPFAKGVNNDFFVNCLAPDNKPEPSILECILQNWLEQKRILRRSLVHGLEASIVKEYHPGQLNYLEIINDEVEGCHVEMAWQSLRQIASSVGFSLTHSVDAVESSLLLPEIVALRDWQGSVLREDGMALIAVAIFERQAQLVLRRTYQALNAWYGDSLTSVERKIFEKYFRVHTCIDDITTDMSLLDIYTNIPEKGGVEVKHADFTRACYVDSLTDVSAKNFQQIYRVFCDVNEKQYNAWNALCREVHKTESLH